MLDSRKTLRVGGAIFAIASSHRNSAFAEKHLSSRVPAVVRGNARRVRLFGPNVALLDFAIACRIGRILEMLSGMP
jgi:hypothetical protein